MSPSSKRCRRARPLRATLLPEGAVGTAGNLTPVTASGHSDDKPVAAHRCTSWAAALASRASRYCPRRDEVVEHDRSPGLVIWRSDELRARSPTALLRPLEGHQRAITDLARPGKDPERQTWPSSPTSLARDGLPRRSSGLPGESPATLVSVSPASKRPRQLSGELFGSGSLCDKTPEEAGAVTIAASHRAEQATEGNLPR